MKMPIAVFYHCSPYLGSGLNSFSCKLITEQLAALERTGLAKAAKELYLGVNGGGESAYALRTSGIGKRILHGLKCKTENRTILAIESWVASHPDWYVLYFHSKGASRSPSDGLAAQWRDCMMRFTVGNWEQCVADLDAGFDAVGCHWIRGLDDTQHYFAGNFWWAKASFLKTLPTICKRPAIIKYGLDSPISRYEAEVWIGNGPRLPKTKDYHTGKHW